MRGIPNKLEDIYSRVLVRPNACWESIRPYWAIRIKGKSILAHRISYCLEHGLDPKDIKGKVVRHECDNPKCINPDHLMLGTQYDNIQDKIRRGRAKYRAVPLYDEDVLVQALQDVAGGMSQRASGKKHGVSQQYLSQLILGKFTRTHCLRLQQLCQQINGPSNEK